MRCLKWAMIVVIGVFFVACNLDNKPKSVIVEPKSVVVCTSDYYFGVYTSLSCHGDTKEIKYPIDKDNKEFINLYELYHQGWKVDTDVSRAQSFMLILSK